MVPRQLRLIYLADVDTLSYFPEAEELERFERTLRAIWAAIQTATETRDFRPNPGRLCDWCDHHASCPAQGGVLPPFPVESLLASEHDRRAVVPGVSAGESRGSGTTAPDAVVMDAAVMDAAVIDAVVGRIAS